MSADAFGRGRWLYGTVSRVIFEWGVVLAIILLPAKDDIVAGDMGHYYTCMISKRYPGTVDEREVEISPTRVMSLGVMIAD